VKRPGVDLSGRMWRRGPAHRAVVLGTVKGTERILALFDRHPRRGWRACAVHAVDGTPEMPSHVRLLLSPPDPGELQALEADALVLALPRDVPRPEAAVGVRTVEARELVEAWERQIPLDLLDGEEDPVLPRRPERGALLAKRALDLALALPAALLSLPLVALLAALVRLESPGPALYTQKRVGQAGRVFRIWKIRSMVEDAEEGGATLTQPEDHRITRVGRFLRRWRLDELPQLWNVLRGEMSLVGPRPEQPEIHEEFLRDLPLLEARLEALPGVTGWAQVRYGYVSTLEQMREKFGYDLYYLRHRSLWFDLEVLLRTLGVVLSGRGVR